MPILSCAPVLIDATFAGILCHIKVSVVMIKRLPARLPKHY